MKHIYLIIFCILVFSGQGYAEIKQTVSPQFYKKLQRAEKLVNQKAYTEALSILQSGRALAKNDYEKATVLRSLAAILALQDNYTKAIPLLSESIKLKAFSDQQQQIAVYNLGQLYLATEQYQQAIATLQPWLSNHASVNAETYVLLANAYSQLQKYRQALPYIKKAISKAKKPPVSWYQLNLAIVYELHDYQSASNILQHLLRLFPDKKLYWDQLVAVYQQLKQYKKAASIKHLAYQHGMYTQEKELLALVNLFLFTGAPYQAGKLIDEELSLGNINSTTKNWELLANAWTQAREFDRAIKALQTASKQSDSGRIQVRLGQIFFEQEQWQKAVIAFNKAVARGDLKNSGNTYLLLGIGYFELGQPSQAKLAFMNAAKYPEFRSSASSWLNFLQQQQEVSHS